MYAIYVCTHVCRLHSLETRSLAEPGLTVSELIIRPSNPPMSHSTGDQHRAAQALTWVLGSGTQILILEPVYSVINQGHKTRHSWVRHHAS